MSFWRLLWVVAAAGAICGVGLAQAPNFGASGIGPPNFRPPKSPPLPYDALEVVTGEAQQIQDADRRAEAVSLLANARALSNVRAHPYDLKTTFISSGSLPSDGSWTLEDISPSANIYRWSAQGPSYSATYLYVNKLLSSNQQSEAIPLRLTQVRDAIFYIYRLMGAYTPLREATGTLQGVELRCILISWPDRGQPLEGTRNWQESEYCVDPKTGLLATYSPVPGLYIHYDYTNAFHFHDKTIPGGFTISEGGRVVIEAKTESVTDPVSPNNPKFDPSGLRAFGVGSVMQPAMWVRDSINAPAPRVNGMGQPGGMIVGPANPSPEANATMQLVVVHGVVSPEGQIAEAEILASTNASLNQRAIDRANAWKSHIVRGDAQPGTTPQSREVIFTFIDLSPGT